MAFDTKDGIIRPREISEFTAEEQKVQARLFTKFLKLDAIAGNIRMLTSAANADTRGVSGLGLIVDRQNAMLSLNDASKKLTFTPESLQKYIFEGIHGSFQKGLNLSESVLVNYSKSIANPGGAVSMNYALLKNFYMNLIEPNTGSAQFRDKVFLRMKEDLVQYFIQKNIDPSAFSYFFTANSIPSQIVKNLKKDPRFVDNLFIQSLEMRKIGDDATRGSIMDNLALPDRRMETEELNALTESFSKLNKIDPAVAKIIATMGILQSGLNKSNISFTEVIPVELYNEVIGTLDYTMSPNDFEAFKAMFVWNNWSLLSPLSLKKLGSLTGVTSSLIGRSTMKKYKDHQIKVYQFKPFTQLSGFTAEVILANKSRKQAPVQTAIASTKFAEDC